MKFGQLIEYNMRSIFHITSQNISQSVGEKLFPDPFLKNLKKVYLMINSLKCYKFFLLYAKFRAL